MNIYKKHSLFIVIVTFMSAVFFILLLEYGLKSTNENFFLENCSSLALNTKTLYGSLSQDTSRYKYLRVIKHKPELITLGSSRVMQFRNTFFKDISFYNAGGVMPNIQNGLNFIKKITSIYTPKIIILGVDMWWLNENFKDFTVLPFSGYKSIFNERFLRYKNLFKNFIKNNNEYLKISKVKELNGNAFEPIEHRLAIGLPAAQLGEGFREDGSYQYGLLLSGKKPIDFLFLDTKKRIKNGSDRFEYADDISEKYFIQLKELILLIKNKGIKLIVLLPPFPNEICNILYNSEKHSKFFISFQKCIEGYCYSNNIEFYNFTSVKSFNGNDKEVLDGFHADEFAYARITTFLSSSKILHQYINTQELKNKLNMK